MTTSVLLYLQFSPSPKLSCYILRRVAWCLLDIYTTKGDYSSGSSQNQKVFFPGEESQKLETETANNFKGQFVLPKRRRNLSSPFTRPPVAQSNFSGYNKEINT